MPVDRARIVRYRCVHLAATAVLLTGCTRWRTQSVSPREVVATRQPSRVRITRLDRSRVVIHQPLLIGDTIYDGRKRREAPLRVPLNDVDEMAIRGWDPLGTAFVTIGTAAVAAVVTIGALWSSRAD